MLSEKKKQALLKKKRRMVVEADDAPKATAKKKFRFNLKRMRKDTEGRGTDFFKFPSGKTNVLVVAHPESDSFYSVDKGHYVPVAGDAKEKKRYFVCPKVRDIDAYCPACHAAALLGKDDKAGDQIKAAERWLSNGFVVEATKRLKHVILQYSWSVLTGISQAIDANIEHEDVDDDETMDLRKVPVVNPFTPTQLVVERTGEGRNGTKYNVTATVKQHTLTSEQRSELVDTGKFIGEPDADALEDAVLEYLGVGSIEDLRDSGTVPAKASKKAAPAKKKKRPAPVEEDEDEEEIEEDDEVEEDEDDEVEEDEDDEDMDMDDIEDEDEDATPDCIGQFGTQNKKKCKACEFKSDCKDLVALDDED